MAATLLTPMSLDILPEEGRFMVRRQGSLTLGNSSPKMDWRAIAGLGAGNKGPTGQGTSSIRRTLSVGSALSDFLGSSSTRKTLEEHSLMRRPVSKDCLESLEVSSNVMENADGNERRGRFEEERKWDFSTHENTFRPGGMMHKNKFPSTQSIAQERQSFGTGKGTGSFPPPSNSFGTGLMRANSTGHIVTPKASKKSIVVEQVQQSFDSLKDRLDFSLKMQPECSAPARPPSVARLLPVSSNISVQPCKDLGILGIAKDVSDLKMSSLPRSLKRRNCKEKNVAIHRSCAFSNAFSAMVFIIKSMHGHALEMEENYALSLVTPMHREIDLSFAWLFQQVFSRTPQYMLSITVLLAEFSVHSLGKDVALAGAIAMAHPKTPVSNDVAAPVKEDVAAGFMKELRRRRKAAPSPKLESVDISPVTNEAMNGFAPKFSAAEEFIMQRMMSEVTKEQEASSGWSSLTFVDRKVAKGLVAPVQVTVSPDNYLCFDRTDLEYQHAIDMQPTNVMLLSNYAQFLYVVRHDNNR